MYSHNASVCTPMACSRSDLWGWYRALCSRLRSCQACLLGGNVLGAHAGPQQRDEPGGSTYIKCISMHPTESEFQKQAGRVFLLPLQQRHPAAGAQYSCILHIPQALSLHFRVQHDCTLIDIYA